MSENELLKQATAPEKIEEVENMIKDSVQKHAHIPMNRKQRRALQRKNKKKKAQTENTIVDTAKKLDYIYLIEKLRELNKKREEEENENT